MNLRGAGWGGVSLGRGLGLLGEGDVKNVLGRDFLSGTSHCGRELTTSCRGRGLPLTLRLRPAFASDVLQVAVTKGVWGGGSDVSGDLCGGVNAVTSLGAR